MRAPQFRIATLLTLVAGAAGATALISGDGWSLVAGLLILVTIPQAYFVQAFAAHLRAKGQQFTIRTWATITILGVGVWSGLAAATCALLSLVTWSIVSVLSVLIS
jgi:hypothetical protein